ncbi:MAG: hypothetical protein GSR85_08700 [Desulfurococcales archaeon]|nr:hypothetical protein [Desulfurococcales archaeon]
MGYRIAVASDDGETISYGHFAHAGEFIIIDEDNGEYKVSETRKNPFSLIPDPDDPRHFDEPEEHIIGGDLMELARLHGVEKYSKLRELALSDVDVIISSGGCPTSIMYFTSQDVRMVFTEPGVDYKEVLKAIKEYGVEKLPPISIFEDGRIVTDF